MKLKRSVKNRHNEKQLTRQHKKRKQLQELHGDSDETFAYIAGYTSDDVPYGITWEEMGEEPPNFDD